MSKDTSNKSEIFRALGDDTRYQLVKLLRDQDEPCVSDLAKSIGISRAGTSQQLQVLARAGILRRERDGQRICYSLNNDEPAVQKVLELMD